MKFVFIIPILILFGLQLLLIQPFFHQGFFPTHDDIQTIRIFEYYQSFKYGVLPPRWSSGLLYGYGYPLFVFYGPLTYFLGTIFVFLGFNFLLATKLVFISGFFLGALGIFFLIRSFVGSLPAFIASVIYSLIPYRAVDVYVRGDLAEFFSYSLFPWVFWFNLKLINSRQFLFIPLFGISLTLLILSHNISTFIYGIFLIAFNLFYIFMFKKENQLNLIKKLSLSAILAILASCFYWLPLLLESQFVQLSKVVSDPYYRYFLTLNQLWYSPWGYGGFLQANPMSLQLGQTIIVMSLLTLILNTIIKTPVKKIIYFIGATFVISILFETKITQFLWDQVIVFHYLQFPWRLHILNTICGTILIGFFFYFLIHLKIYQQKFGKFLFFLVGLFLILLSFQESYSFFRAKSFMEAKPMAATTTGEEYLPKWVGFLPNSYSPDKVEFLEGDGKLENLEWGYHQKKMTIINQKNTRIRIAHIYYPGWTAYVNNKPVNIRYDNKFAQMEIEVPRGTNSVVFIFQRTWWRWIADITSVIGLLGILFLTVQNITYRKKMELSR
ncbi:MAG: 6-pyruvoyl-tetrahydropterin synthase-related protein [Candidatus Daviesbacteria bacterium]